MEKKTGKEPNLFMELVRRDIVYLILLLLVVGAMLFMYQEASSYTEKCNSHWEEQLISCGCTMDYNEPFNESFDPLSLDINYSN